VGGGSLLNKSLLSLMLQVLLGLSCVMFDASKIAQLSPVITDSARASILAADVSSCSKALSDATCVPTFTARVARYNDGKGLPAAPAGTEYRFDIAKQLWVATNKTTFQQVPGGELRDGFKYLLGVKFLPTGAAAAARWLETFHCYQRE
jgi:hypothetical protein